MNYSEDQFRIIIDPIPTLAWSGRADGAAEFFNRRWVGNAGLSTEEALAWGWKVTIHAHEPADDGDIPRRCEVLAAV